MGASVRLVLVKYATNTVFEQDLALHCCIVACECLTRGAPNGRFCWRRRPRANSVGMIMYGSNVPTPKEGIFGQGLSEYLPFTWPSQAQRIGVLHLSADLTGY